MSQLVEIGPREVFRDELTWRTHLVFAHLMHCRAVARFSAAEREDLETHCGCSFVEAAETGQALLGLTRGEVVALAEQIEAPWDHRAIRDAADAFRREGTASVESRGLRAALLRRAGRDLAERHR